jgi:hypothetical protein
MKAIPCAAAVALWLAGCQGPKGDPGLAGRLLRRAKALEEITSELVDAFKAKRMTDGVVYRSEAAARQCR